VGKLPNRLGFDGTLPSNATMWWRKQREVAISQQRSSMPCATVASGEVASAQQLVLF
jgi:hypothetical protein